MAAPMRTAQSFSPMPNERGHDDLVRELGRVTSGEMAHESTDEEMLRRDVRLKLATDAVNSGYYVFKLPRLFQSMHMPKAVRNRLGTIASRENKRLSDTHKFVRQRIARRAAQIYVEHGDIKAIWMDRQSFCESANWSDSMSAERSQRICKVISDEILIFNNENAAAPDGSLVGHIPPLDVVLPLRTNACRLKRSRFQVPAPRSARHFAYYPGGNAPAFAAFLGSDFVAKLQSDQRFFVETVRDADAEHDGRDAGEDPEDGRDVGKLLVGVDAGSPAGLWTPVTPFEGSQQKADHNLRYPPCPDGKRRAL